MYKRAWFTILAFALVAPAFGQTAQVGADAKARGSDKLRVEYVHYRQAQWESARVEEFEKEPANEGGLVYVYFRNVTDEPVDLRYWRINRQDESYWRLNHHIAWDRGYQRRVAPGELGVLEVNGLTKDFSPGENFDFQYVGSSWRPVTRFRGVLGEDPVQIACIRVLEGLQELEVHVRHMGDGEITLGTTTVEKHTVVGVDWVGSPIAGPGHAIARVKLGEPLALSELTVVGIELTGGEAARTVYAHRRAFVDFFPIGTWSGNEETYALLRRLHIDTIVKGGSSTDPFFSELVHKYGFRTIVHTGQPVNVDMVRDLGTQPAVACWMLQDEPDWSIPSNIMLFCDRTVRHYNKTVPTFITLCRNIKFFEYAPISDIPCMDHYSVTAPSSSKWPKPYGTLLEETGWYTRDLKRASEPKPIWIWSQAIANWGQRPKRPVPTPEELAAQLVLNLGQGAKGILWFNYDHKVAERFPDVRNAMRNWGRVLEVLRDEFLTSEPAALNVTAPEAVDVAPLVTRDMLLLCITNLDYEIHPEAYPFQEKKDIEIGVALPTWLMPTTALRVSPAGIEALPCRVEDGNAHVTLGGLKACEVIALPNAAETQARFEERYRRALEDERRAY